MTEQEFEELRRPYVEQLAAIQADYRRMAQPVIAILTELERYRPVIHRYVIVDSMLQEISQKP